MFEYEGGERIQFSFRPPRQYLSRVVAVCMDLSEFMFQYLWNGYWRNEANVESSNIHVYVVLGSHLVFV